MMVKTIKRVEQGFNSEKVISPSKEAQICLNCTETECKGYCGKISKKRTKKDEKKNI